MGNARTREEIGTKPCPECGGTGRYKVDPHEGCEECTGVGRVLAELPRLAVQEQHAGGWHTMIRFDGDDFGAAKTYRETYERLHEGKKYRIVQEIDEATP